MDATKESAPIIEIGPAGRVASVNLGAESPCVRINASTSDGKSVTLRCIALLLTAARAWFPPRGAGATGCAGW
ncbi:hypothetical protein GCM10010515_07390 [Streptomyces fructofermentans]|uniref:Uncharacterized protein n=1 Tax=Streptomyces fructofermentans TaxID=152141 RepID=A0A918K258_9ACTN|nr:hypothetical protein GCM10010515_07390 [Streptomyces fructofermentans]